MKRNVEMDDTLDERIADVKQEVKERFDEIVKENPDYNSEDIYQEIVDGISEIVDSNTPIYNKEIDDLYYLYGNELEETYENAGCYHEQPNNYRQVCIYFYLEEQAHEYFRELQTEFELAQE